jgi:hypothetical protein
MTAACSILPGHTYLMPAGCTTCHRHARRADLALCVESARIDLALMVARHATLLRSAAAQARAGHRAEANRLNALRIEALAWLNLNPCADGAMIKVTT